MLPTLFDFLIHYHLHYWQITRFTLLYNLASLLRFKKLLTIKQRPVRYFIQHYLLNLRYQRE